ncbi:MAG TPA: hypothetical protein VMV70_09255 [Gallionella sp.]|nr:hypothetical protein [Gallionella sp.]
MINDQITRYVIAVVMVVLGAIIMFLAPEIWQGMCLIDAGVSPASR